MSGPDNAADSARIRSRRVPIHDPAPRIARAVPTFGMPDPHDYRYGLSDPSLRPAIPEKRGSLADRAAARFAPTLVHPVKSQGQNTGSEHR